MTNGVSELAATSNLITTKIYILNWLILIRNGFFFKVFGLPITFFVQFRHQKIYSIFWQKIVGYVFGDHHVNSNIIIMPFLAVLNFLAFLKHLGHFDWLNTREAQCASLGQPRNSQMPAKLGLRLQNRY